jgi:hypothetical protein
MNQFNRATTALNTVQTANAQTLRLRLHLNVIGNRSFSIII